MRLWLLRRIRRDQRHLKSQSYLQQQYPSSSSLSERCPPSSLKAWLNKHRISYSFANVGITSEIDGEVELEFLPNPRHALIEAIEDRYRFNRVL